VRARLRLLVLLIVVGAIVRSSVAPLGDPSALVTPGCALESISFSVNGAPAPLVTATSGDHLTVTFEVPDGCTNRLSFASFVAPAPTFDGSRLGQQALFSKEVGVFGSGRHSMEVDVFEFPEGDVHDCAAARAAAEAASEDLRQAVRDRMASSPEYREQVEQEMRVKAATEPGGANLNGPYDSTCDGSPSENGSGDGEAVGRPCAGCVGGADDKNPPGQLPGGNDPNAGYECDENQGVGQSNPAHSGCENFQVDLSYHPLDEEGTAHDHDSGLIAGLFCVRSTAQCYITDRTGSGAVVGS
jgi:hypothetical protein